jgi:hypothetical protein
MNITKQAASDKEKNVAGIKTVSRTLVLAFSFLLAAVLLAQAVEVGQQAPDFELASTKGGKFRLSSLKGKNVLINFYVLDFSPA